jgi:hypothetical protein
MLEYCAVCGVRSIWHSVRLVDERCGQAKGPIQPAAVVELSGLCSPDRGQKRRSGSLRLHPDSGPPTPWTKSTIRPPMLLSDRDGLACLPQTRMMLAAKFNLPRRHSPGSSPMHRLYGHRPEYRSRQCRPWPACSCRPARHKRLRLDLRCLSECFPKCRQHQARGRMERQYSCISSIEPFPQSKAARLFRTVS